MFRQALRILIRGHGPRKTRFHDLKGNAIPPASFPYLPLMAMDWLLRISLGRQRAVPWLSYRATHVIWRLLTPTSRVLEFGAGMSTIWFAQHAASVVSIESNSDWHQRVRCMLTARGLTNSDLRLRAADCESYSDLTDLPPYSFDFALIDGDCRVQSIKPALQMVRPGGWIYLDNTDTSGREAEAILLHSSRCKARRYFTDLGPGLAFAWEGLLVQLGDDGQ